ADGLHDVPCAGLDGAEEDRSAARVDEAGRGRSADGDAGGPCAPRAEASPVEQAREGGGVGRAQVGGADSHHGVAREAVAREQSIDPRGGGRSVPPVVACVQHVDTKCFVAAERDSRG
ncbi:MAG: hypothetical protein ACK56I_06875, partial [bacterium]